MPHPFFWIDAFTSVAYGGNPCAVFLEADGLSASQMQRLAREINLSETAFVSRSKRADFEARYFTPEEELPFAGHPTIAVAHALARSGRLSFVDKLATARLGLPAGVIPLRVRVSGSGSEVTMSQLKPRFLRRYDRAEVAGIFGLRVDDLLDDVSPQTVSTGTPILMVALKTHEALKRVHYPDPARYAEFKTSGDFFYPHHFVLRGATEGGTTFARSVALPPGGLEDPFTGSSTGCMAAYLWKHGLLAKPRFVAQQGHWMKRPGEAQVEVIGPPGDIERVELSGAATTVFAGELEILARD